MNELPSEEEKAGLGDGSAVSKGLPSEVVLHTTLGDIHIRLFVAECPKTVENFTTHVKNKYYDGVVFHRVIKG